MANAGFNAATDIFGLGEKWKVKSSDLNASVSTAECKNFLGDVTHRDQYGQKIAPTAEYECVADDAALPDLGKVVTIDGKTVVISQISVSTQAGSAPTATVTGTQIEDGGTAKRTYVLPELSFSPRHRAQDITGDLGESAPSTLTSASFTFAIDVSLAEPKGEISASDESNGRYEAQYTHACGDGQVPVAPSVSGNGKVVSAPVSKSSPENDYVICTYTISGTLAGKEAEE